MVSPQLLDYVRQQQAAGVPKEEIAKSLIASGWQVSDINEALSPNPTTTQPLPAPLPSAGSMTETSHQTGNSQKLAPIGQLFSDSFALYKEHFWTLIVLIAIPYFVFGSGWLLVAGGMVWGLVLYILGLLLFLPAGMGVICALFKGTEVAQSLRAGFSLFFPALWMSILMFLVVIGGYVMLIVPGILMSLWFSLSSFALVIEGKRGLNALLQSREYVRGYWWSIFVRFLLLSIPLMLLYGALSVLLGKPTAGVVYMVVSIFISPFASVYLYKIYQNLAALKPTLAASQPASGRGFLITSGVIGLLSPIIFFVLFSSLLLVFIPFSSLNPLHRGSPYAVEHYPYAAAFDPTSNSLWIVGADTNPAMTASTSIATKFNVLTGTTTATFSVGVEPRAITFDPSTNSMWIANHGASTVTKLNASSGSLIGTYAVGTQPSPRAAFQSSPVAIIFEPITNSVWVAPETSSIVVKLDASTGAIRGVYGVGTSTISYEPFVYPSGIAFDPFTKSIWVTDRGINSVAKLDVSTGVLRGVYPVGTSPHGIAFDPVTNSIWVANEASNTVTKINVSTGAVVDTYPVGDRPRSVAFDPTTKSVWVTNYASNNVSKINVITGMKTDYPVGLGPTSIISDSIANSIWVVNNRSSTITEIKVK